MTEADPEAAGYPLLFGQFLCVAECMGLSGMVAILKVARWHILSIKASIGTRVVQSVVLIALIILIAMTLMDYLANDLSKAKTLVHLPLTSCGFLSQLKMIAYTIIIGCNYITPLMLWNETTTINPRSTKSAVMVLTSTADRQGSPSQCFAYAWLLGT